MDGNALHPVRPPKMFVWWMLCAITLCFAAMPRYEASYADEDARVKAKRLIESLSDSSPEAAIEALEVALSASRDEASVKILQRALAQRQTAAAMFGSAIATYESLTRKDPQPEDLVALGHVRLALAKREAASGGSNAVVTPLLMDAIEATDSLSVKPNAGLSPTLRLRLLTTRGEALRWHGQPKEAAALYHSADPETFDKGVRKRLWDGCARAHYAAKEYGASAEAFARAQNPRAAAAAWSAEKNREKALGVYRELMQTALTSADEEGVTPFATVSGEAFRSSRFFHGLAELDTIAETLKPSNEKQRADLLAFRASIREARGDEATARALLDEALPLIQKHGTSAEVARTRVNVGRLLVAVTGDAAAAARTQAVNHFMAAIDEPSTHADAVYMLSQLAGVYDRRMWMDPTAVDECLRIQRALTQAKPNDATVWSNLGNSLRRAGFTDESLTAYEKAARLDAEDPVLRSDQGLALSAAGKFDEALHAFDVSVSLDEGYLAGYQNAARQLVLRGQVEKASGRLGRAVRVARREGRRSDTYRFLWEQAWRASRRPGLR